MDRRGHFYGFVAMVAGIVCLAMGYFTTELISLPSLVSAIAFVFSLVAAVRAVTCTARAKLGAGPRKQLAAAAAADLAEENQASAPTPPSTGQADAPHKA
jgi:hypothetical protein